MKTIVKRGKIKRVNDELAVRLVMDDGWKFCPKSEWKTKVRDKVPEGASEKIAPVTTSDKRKQRKEKKIKDKPIGGEK